MADGVSSLAALAMVARHHDVLLSVEQIQRENGLADGPVSLQALVNCAARAGLLAKPVRLDWDALSALRKALPVIVPLNNGSCWVLVGVTGGDTQPVAYLRDPHDPGGSALTVDRLRFEAAWTGEVILVKREFELLDDEQPFSLRLILAAILKERRLVRDLVLAALLLGVIALAPVIFWRLLSDKVIYYHAVSTFQVICAGMIVVTIAETLLSFARSTMVHVLTTRVDIRLSEYMFDKVLSLPIDFFERTQVGLIARDMNEIWRVRNFLTGQLFGTVLDSMTLIYLLPVMFAFNPLLSTMVLGVCAVIVAWLVGMLPTYRRVSTAVQEAEGLRGAFLIETLQSMRTLK